MTFASAERALPDRCLSRQLLDPGCYVRVLNCLIFGDAAVPDPAGDTHFELLGADIRRVESLVKAILNINAVIHLTAIVGAWLVRIRPI